MEKPAAQKKLLNKRIPTIIGLLVLVVALVAGIFFLGEGPGIFAPRATPETTPQKIKVTNVTDNSFTISFLTDESTPGFVNYGTGAGDLNSQASDDRDQLAGTVSDYQLHHITVRGLQPTTTYYYTLGTGSNSKFDNSGAPFTIQTTARSGIPAAAKTIYGSVSNQAGNPADGAVVYVTLANAGEMSSLVKASGSWAVPLSNARTKDGSGYAQISDIDTILLTVQGLLAGDVISYNTTVAQAQPVQTLTFGQTNPTTPVVPTPTPTTPEATPTPSATPTPTPTTPVDPYSGPAEATPSAEIVNLEKTGYQVVTTTQPTITGKAAPNVVVSIEVNSHTQIHEEITADANGNFELDIAALSENLEPGDHVVNYSYTDPATGQLVTRTVAFTVEAPQQLAQAQPFSTLNPFPPTTPATQAATASPSATATPEARVTTPATQAAVPVSGSVGTTLALVFGGLFFMISGLWSLWISQQLGKNEVEF